MSSMVSDTLTSGVADTCKRRFLKENEVLLVCLVLPQVKEA